MDQMTAALKAICDKLEKECPGCNQHGQPGIHVRPIKDQHNRASTEAIPCPWCALRKQGQAALIAEA